MFIEVSLRDGKAHCYFLCSAVLFSRHASLEFEAKNDRAWAVYVAKEGWDYPFSTRRLTLKSGARKIGLSAALYGGAMISGMSHNLRGGGTISIEKLKALLSRNEPISVDDAGGSLLVTFPNKGGDLSEAFARAIECSLDHAPH